MIPFFSYLREKAREAVLAGVQDALDQIDPVARDRPGSGALPVPSPTPPAGGPAAGGPTPLPPAGGPMSGQFAQTAAALGPSAQAALPAGPSSPKRGRPRRDGQSQ